MVQRVKDSLSKGSDFVFNCQMGRGRTTTGMVTACLIATVEYGGYIQLSDSPTEEALEESYDSMDGPSEEETYLQGKCIQAHSPIFLTNHAPGEYKTILHLVGVLSHGKMAKRLTDRAIDLMQDVQNLRKAIYECVSPHSCSFRLLNKKKPFLSYKLKVDACEKGSTKQRKLFSVGINYL